MQSGYSGITALHKNSQYNGGFCEWYYTAIENIAVWPTVGFNQEFTTEPQLVATKNWYGPIAVPNNLVGITEAQERDKRGIFYKLKLEGIQVGDSRENTINLENMPYYKYVVVGKFRAGGLFKMFGSAESSLAFDHDFDSGKGMAGLSKSPFSFTGDSLNKGIVLPSFQNQNSIPSIGGAGGGNNGGAVVSTVNQTETIVFNNQSTINIPWSLSRKNAFGIFPLIQVWFDDGAKFSLANVPIICDTPPPNTTQFTIDVTGITNGFIQIK